MKITQHFDSTEFDCRDGTPYPKVYIKDGRLKSLCEALEVIRKECGGKPIGVDSGFRTPEYNKKVKGSRLSQHLVGKAADIKIKGVPASKVYQIILKLRQEGKIPMGGIGRYSTFTHYDIRGFAANWSGK